MDLKSKLFGFGIFGRPVSVLSQEEIEEALGSSYAEIVSAVEIEKLRSSFTLNPLACIEGKEPIRPEHIVRMRTTAWRDYIFGPGVNILSKEYFFLIDYLLRTSEFVNTAVIRKDLGIEPKTLHYIGKKLKQFNVIEDRKENNMSFIRLNFIEEKPPVEKSISDEIFASENCLEVRDLCLYDNMPLCDQVKMLIEGAEEGMDTKMLYKKTGLSCRTGLKVMQKLCAQNSEDLCIVTEICYKSSVSKCYVRSVYEKITKKRLERITGNAGTNNQKTISAQEKEAALCFLAGKYKSFVLGKEIINEISELTGWAYTFDRKTLINAAKGAGLVVTRLEVPGGWRYIISKEAYDRETQVKSKEDGIAGTNYEKFRRRIRNAFLQNASYVKLDNGHALNNWRACKKLLEFFYMLVEGSCEDVVEVADLFNRIPTGLFFELNAFNNPCFRFNAGFSVWKNNLERFQDLGIQLDRNRSIFYTDNDMQLIKPEVYAIANAVDDMPLGEYKSLLSKRYLEVIEHKMQSKKYLAPLKRLQKERFIEFIRETSSLFIKKGTTGLGDTRLQTLIDNTQEKVYVDYNIRERVYRMACGMDQGNFEECIRAFLFKTYPEQVASSLHSKLLKPVPPEKVVRTKVTELPEKHRDLYLKIKEAIVLGSFAGFRVYAGYENIEVEAVLRYMAHRKIIYHRFISRNASTIPLNLNFVSMFSKNPNFYRKHTSVENDLLKTYFYRVYRMVEEGGSVDTCAILEKLVFIEDFELSLFLKTYDDVFETKMIDEFTLVSLRNVGDPFLD